ncbi:MAG: M23 family metallopeptidase [Holosporales bacterium]|jgi:lipoprotein NlpD|nr:M23 family metallopeptidase [Holosporales bacterium]
MMSLRSLCGAVLAVALTACSSNRQDGGPEVIQIERVDPYHIVEEGDTVGSIATQYGMSRSDLIKLNKLHPPYQLYVGQRILIILKPDGSETAPKTPVKEKDEAPVEQVEKKEEEITIDDINHVDSNDAAKQEEEAPSDYVWPIVDGKSKVSQPFTDGGIMIDASAGTPVRSIADGIVIISGRPEGDAAAYGITVVVKHASKNTISIYANLQEASVKANEKVKKGKIIGKVGKSGTITTKSQLYLEINTVTGGDRQPVDPKKVLP